MNSRLRILITGFGPFPGSPVNPTQPLVARLVKLRRPAFGDVDRIPHIFPVSYSAVDRELPELLARHQPDALLMFGLASRTPFIRVETRARNAVTMLWPDAEHTNVRQACIEPGADAQLFGAHTARLLLAARRTGVDARLSRNAGIAAAQAPGGPRPATFIHVPLLARDPASRRMTLDQLVGAGEALLLETIRLARASRIARRL
jgi:pyroglutamyl-peptidase